ncbi:MAG: SDR family oxidoreductase [Phycisphaerales bacterium]|jgi:NADP-dependent 3-hydroxy acid dehydrogenase YdfG|nr:SDR family oxidoreductase [Phycisphaerales bacterium]
MPEYPLKNRVGIVTGATAGIGEAIADSLVELGACVVLNGRREEVLKRMLARYGGEDVSCVSGDAADESVIEKLLNAAREMLGHPGQEADVVVINAGRGLRGSVIDSDSAQWEEMIRTNLLGAARLLRASANRMLAEIAASPDMPLSKARDIVVIGSTVGRHVSPFSSMYGATKFGVHGLVEGARRELGPKGIRVTLIEPGFVESEFQGVAGYDPKWFEGVRDRIGPVLTPKDVAELVTWIVSRPAHVHVSDALLRPTRQDYP